MNISFTVPIHNGWGRLGNDDGMLIIMTGCLFL